MLLERLLLANRARHDAAKLRMVQFPFSSFAENRVVLQTPERVGSFFREIPLIQSLRRELGGLNKGKALP